MGLITIKTFDNSIDAHLLRTKLESEGITCFIFDENLITLNPLYSLSLGGIKLKINEIHLQQTKEIIEGVDNIKLTNDNKDIIKCPYCQSDDLYYGFKSMGDAKGFMAIIFAFLFMAFPLYYKTVNKCKSCGKEFK
tara:strand:- start:1159 stop:1566 length:408 start_codon:yes stop_codon:yes gene_type:complete